MSVIISLCEYRKNRQGLNMKELVENICQHDCIGCAEIVNPYWKTEQEHKWYEDKAKELGVICHDMTIY